MIELRKHATECRPFSVSGKATSASRARSRVAAGLGVVEESRHVSKQCAREPGDLQSVCASRPEMRDTEMRDIPPKLVRTTARSSCSTDRSSICAWTNSEKDQKGSKEKMACSWATGHLLHESLGYTYHVFLYALKFLF